MIVSFIIACSALIFISLSVVLQIHHLLSLLHKIDCFSIQSLTQVHNKLPTLYLNSNLNKMDHIVFHKHLKESLNCITFNEYIEKGGWKLKQMETVSSMLSKHLTRNGKRERTKDAYIKYNLKFLHFITKHYKRVQTRHI